MSGPFELAVRVYWEDTDAGGVVFYANYLKFFERARTEWLRSLGFEQQRLRDDEHILFVVTDTRSRHQAPARLDDLLHVSATVREQTRTTLTFVQQARRGSTLLAEGEIRIACVHADEAGTFRPRRIPNPLLEAIASAP